MTRVAPEPSGDAPGGDIAAQGVRTPRLTAAEYDVLPEILTSGEVARILQVHRAQVARWASEGVLPGGRIGRTWRFSKSVIERLVAGGGPHERRGE
ncbi:helix-turn-helix domain-containing protein [Sanguibacter suarezii]|uniref:helix-turn-helix domain-containing protein n=1 Tax=Sanguibacter suarezii TaxID=60921 RepID=UPI00082E6DA7|nr:helix-turn-helix domain-containing protein [Sanguibacter suarezii]